MQGLQLLNRLPDNVRHAIITKYGSLENYYKEVYSLYELEKRWFFIKTDEAKVKRQKIEDQLFALEEELGKFGLEDGHVVLTVISSDYGDHVLNEYMKKMGLK